VEKESAAVAPGFREIAVYYQKDVWPTLMHEPQESVSGDIIHVTTSELKALDRWESNYTRRLINTSRGKAFTYVFRKFDGGLGGRAS
jgi:hypothetical protein